MSYDMEANKLEKAKKKVNLTEVEKKQRDEWKISVSNKLGDVKRPSKLSIYKVPNKLVKVEEDAYRPSLVSIGPFHHLNKELLAIEDHKWRYMLHLFSRTGDAVATLDECTKAMFDLERKARRCYSENIAFDKHELAKILLVDGCFILELFLRCSDINKYKDKVDNPIINNAWTVATLQHDLALLENQIPFKVLQKLFDIIKKNVSLPIPYSFTKYNVVSLALLFFKSALGMSNQAVESKSLNLTGDHLLDILHNVYLPPTYDKIPEILHNFHLPKSNKSPKPQGLQRSGFKDCATQLLKGGIQFQGDTALAAEGNSLHINFTSGVVTMPPLYIQEATVTIFRNLIAFEQCSIGSSHCIASYAFLMRSLLRSSQDVEVLQEKGIITNNLDCNAQDVTTLFKSMCQGVVLKEFCFSSLCEAVKDYPRSSLNWRRIKAIANVRWSGYKLVLGRDYFSNPWSTTSFLAALVLLIFTTVQTYYAVRSYYPH